MLVHLGKRQSSRLHLHNCIHTKNNTNADGQCAVQQRVLLEEVARLQLQVVVTLRLREQQRQQRVQQREQHGKRRAQVQEGGRRG